MNKTFFLRNIATQGAVGYGQAPGTLATIMTIPVVYFFGIHSFTTSWYYFVFVGLFFLFGLYAIKHALPFFKDTDPSAIVIDEMAGFLLVFAGVCVTWKTLLIGFILFRLLDIYKPLGIGHLDNMHGPWGIMLDDLVAALVSNGVLQLLLYTQLI